MWKWVHNIKFLDNRGSNLFTYHDNDTPGAHLFFRNVMEYCHH